MTSELFELVVDGGSSDALVRLAERVGNADGGIEAVRLLGDEATVKELLFDIAIIGDYRASQEAMTHGFVDALQVSVRRRDRETSEGVGDDPNTIEATVPDGGQLRRSNASRVGLRDLPHDEAFASTEEWFSAVAEEQGIEPETLREVARRANNGAESVQKRRSLELAFEHHLERANKRGRGYVEIRTAGSPGPRHYHYLDNGKGRGGAHYFRGLTPAMKVDIRRLAIAENLTVLAEGEAYISVSHEQFDVAADVQFAERVISEVFGGSLSDIVAVEEVIGREVTCSWIA